MILTTLVLPAPFGPSRPNAWPASTSNVTPSTAHGSPLRYRLRRSRTLTTAVALYTSQGDFGLALALGFILLVLALLVNVALQVLQGRANA